MIAVNIVSLLLHTGLYSILSCKIKAVTYIHLKSMVRRNIHIQCKKLYMYILTTFIDASRLYILQTPVAPIRIPVALQVLIFATSEICAFLHIGVFVLDKMAGVLWDVHEYHCSGFQRSTS